MRLRQTIAAAGIVAASLGSLTACGSTGKADGSTAPTVASASPASGSSSASKQGSGHLDKGALIEAVTVAQKKAGSAHVTMSTSGSVSMTAQGDVGYQGSRPQMQMTMSMAQMGAGRIQLRFVDGVIYMAIPKLTPAGKFIKIDPSDPSNPMSKSFGSLSQQMDPLNSLAAMKAAVRTVKYVGHDKVGGVDTDHYLVTVSSAPLLKAMKTKSVPGMPAQLTYDMWLGSDNLLRRMRFDVEGLKTEMLMSKWGEPVHVQAPPSSQVVDPSRVAG